MMPFNNPYSNAGPNNPPVPYQQGINPGAMMGNGPNNNRKGENNNFEPNKTLFLGDLSYFCTEDDLFNLFSPYGTVNTIRVQRGVSGEPLLHGYISFHDPNAARQALTEMDGISFMGRNLRIQMGTVNHHNKEKLGFSDSKNFTQIHVSFICKRGRGFVVNEQVLRDIFTPFGQIADVAIKKHSRNPKQQRQTGYGFIYFVSAEDACRAVIALKNTTLHDITFDCNISHKSEHMIRSMLEPGTPAPPPVTVSPPPAVPPAIAAPVQNYNNSGYTVTPPSGGGGRGGGGYGGPRGYGNHHYYQSSHYQPSHPVESDYSSSRVLGPRGGNHHYRQSYGGVTGGGGEDGFGPAGNYSPASYAASGPSFHEDFQPRGYPYQMTQDPLSGSAGFGSMTGLGGLSDPFGPVDPYLNVTVTGSLGGGGGGVGSAAGERLSSGNRSRQSPLEFGRDLAEFDASSSSVLPKIPPPYPTQSPVPPSLLTAVPELDLTNPTAAATILPAALNSHHSINTLTSLATATDGVTTNATGSPKGESSSAKHARNNSLKSTTSSADAAHPGALSQHSQHQLEESLLYSFQSLSLPKEEDHRLGSVKVESLAPENR